MCGFIAGTKKVLESNGVRNLLDKQKHRGTDGYGAIALYDNGTSTYIKYMASKPLVKWIDKLKGNPYVFIHHRATSVGGTKLKLAHPLVYKETILMQNGTNRDPFMMVTPAESDSEALAMLAHDMSAEELDLYILNDVGVIIFRKDDKFYLHRDDTRPLHLHETGLIASEPLIKGTWNMVDEGLFPVTYTGGKLVGLDLFGSSKIEDVGSVQVCSFCKKRHYTPKGFTVCNSCVVEGIPQKKEYAHHSTVGNSVDNYDDDYDDNQYGWGWQGGNYVRKKHGKLPVESTASTNEETQSRHSDEKIVLELVSSSQTFAKTTKRVYGTPVKLGDDYYLVPGGADDHAAVFLVSEKKMADDSTYAYKNGTLPLNNEMPKLIELGKLSVYWNEEDKSYDLQQNVYYLEGDLLSQEDKDLLLYDEYMAGYILPSTYDFSPETYAGWC